MSDRLIPLREVSRVTSLSPSQIRREVKAERFPKSVPVTEKRVAWSESAVAAWVAAKLGSGVRHEAA